VDALLLFLGVAVVIGGAVAGVARLVLRRGVAPRRHVTAIALVAGVAGFATWLVFAYDWVVYSLSENGPSYYAFSDYMEYRRAVEGFAGVAIGLGYALLASAAVAGAAFLGRRPGSWWFVPAAFAAAGSIGLPALVPAVLPRAEYGKDRVYYLSRGGPYEVPPGVGRPTVCFAYGIERPDGPLPPGETDPELCLQFRRTPASETLEVYDIADELNESSIRPRDSAGDLSIEGLEIASADWTGDAPPPAQPTVSLPSAVEPPAGDEETKAKVLRLSAHMESCRRTELDYVPCAQPDMLRHAGIPLGAVSVETVTRDGYTIVGRSATGNSFTLSRHRPGRERRSCSMPGAEGCPGTSGRW
jgi:hypothetical protein